MAEQIMDQNIAPQIDELLYGQRFRYVLICLNIAENLAVNQPEAQE